MERNETEEGVDLCSPIPSLFPQAKARTFFFTFNNSISISSLVTMIASVATMLKMFREEGFLGLELW